MSGHRARRADEAQLVLDLDAAQHPAVEHARVLRAEVGLPPSITSFEVLAQVRRILDPGVDRPAQAAAVTRRAS